MDLTPEDLRQRLVSAVETALYLDECLLRCRESSSGESKDLPVLVLDAPDCVDARMEVGAWVTSLRSRDEAGSAPQIVSGRLPGAGESGPGYVDEPRYGRPYVAVLSAPPGMSADTISARVQALVEHVIGAWEGRNLIAAVVIRQEQS